MRKQTDVRTLRVLTTNQTPLRGKLNKHNYNENPTKLTLQQTHVKFKLPDFIDFLPGLNILEG